VRTRPSACAASWATRRPTRRAPTTARPWRSTGAAYIKCAGQLPPSPLYPAVSHAPGRRLAAPPGGGAVGRGVPAAAASLVRRVGGALDQRGDGGRRGAGRAAALGVCGAPPRQRRLTRPSNMRTPTPRLRGPLLVVVFFLAFCGGCARHAGWGGLWGVRLCLRLRTAAGVGGGPVHGQPDGPLPNGVRRARGTPQGARSGPAVDVTRPRLPVQRGEGEGQVRGETAGAATVGMCAAGLK
jgi:hypothetical protein